MKVSQGLKRINKFKWNIRYINSFILSPMMTPPLYPPGIPGESSDLV
jgi:hypothetical protein